MTSSTIRDRPSPVRTLSLLLPSAQRVLSALPGRGLQDVLQALLQRRPARHSPPGRPLDFCGILQLILYRVVYQALVLQPTAVETAADLGRYLLWAVLASILRVSGQFHVVVGVLCLFGFNLPETHHSYFLASSFTDFWCRINIYWKDFMMKIFDHPAYFGTEVNGARSGRWGSR